jgi:hypothetical protein
VDDNSGEPQDKLAFGVIGDLADAFPNGEIKPVLGGVDCDEFSFTEGLRQGNQDDNQVGTRGASFFSLVIRLC